MSYPIDEIRTQFPALQRTVKDKPVVFFDGPSGSQVCQQSIDAMVDYMTHGSANLGSPYPTSQESDQVVADARLAMADILGYQPQEIAFGQNMTSLTMDLSRAFGLMWMGSENIVVTEIDHRANVDPWIIAATEKGVEVRWIKLDPDTLTLDYSNLDKLIDDNTAVVAISHASNGVGTIVDLGRVVQKAKEHDAVVVMDAVHSAPHLHIDRAILGVDIVLCSAYKFFGPHVGIMAIREELFEKLPIYRISTASQVHPGKAETGTQSIEGLAGVSATVDFIASLGEGESRIERITTAFKAIHTHEQELAEYIRSQLLNHPAITLYQAEVSKTPTIAFRHAKYQPTEVVEILGKQGIFLGGGHFYAKTIAEVLGIQELGGWNRIGMAPYNTMEEAERFVRALLSL